MNIELLKKIRDPKIYLESFCKIKGKKPGLIPFILNEAQKDLFNTLNKANRVIILKVRQLGFSTAVAGYFYVKTIMTPGTNTALIGYNSDLTAELLDKIKTFYASTPPEIRPTIDYNTKYEISFPKVNSKIFVLPSTMTVGRGYTLHNCLAAGTKIIMGDYFTKKIEEIKVGDKIVNGKGGYSIVRGVINKKFKGKIFRLKIYGSDDLVATNDHLILTRKDGWKSINDVEVGDYIMHLYGEAKITSKKQEEYNGLVYDIGLSEEPHSYLTTSGVVHNCLATELAFWEKQDEKMTAIENSVPDDGTIVVESCVSGDTIVFTDNGPRRVRKIHDWNKYPKGFSEGKKILIDGYLGAQPTSTYYNSGTKNIIKIITERGLELKMSFVHQLYILKNGKLEFVKSKDLKIGDKIFMRYGQGMWGKNDTVNDSLIFKKISPQLAYFVGLVVGGGYINSKWNEISFIDIGERIFSPLERKIPNLKFLWKGDNLICHNLSVINFLKEYVGLEKRNPKDRDVPDIIFEWSKNNIIEFLRGLFSNWGYIKKENNILFFLESKKIVNTVQVLLLNLGILSKVVYSEGSPAIISVDKNFFTDIYYNFDKNKYFYDKIRKIEKGGREIVYDFNVKNGHTVTYNGMVGHQTPNGQGNLYHRMYMSEDNGYVKKRYDWWWGYTKEQVELKRKRMNNPLKFAQEMGCEFLASGRQVFDKGVIKDQLKNVIKEGEKRKLSDVDGKKYDFTVKTIDKLRIYRPAEAEGIYVIGADVSEGVVGGDFSSAIIWDRKTGEEVAFFRGWVPPDVFGEMLNKWGRWYNNALMVVEINNHGLTTVTALRKLLYPSMYFRQSKFETISSTISDKIGWKTTKITKSLMLDDFSQALRDKLLIIHSKEIIDEMMVFIYNDSGYAVPQRGFHDDTIMAAAIGFQGFKMLAPQKLTQLNYEEHLPKSFIY